MSVWIERRPNRSGISYRVIFTLGGRGARRHYLATYSSRLDAEVAADWARSELAAMRVPHLHALAGRDVLWAADVDEAMRLIDETVGSESDGTVYFLKGGEWPLVKIGWTGETLAGRIARLQTGSPLRLTAIASVPGTKHLEQSLHAVFDDDRVLGEWFRHTDDLQRVIEHARAQGIRKAPSAGGT